MLILWETFSFAKQFLNNRAFPEENQWNHTLSLSVDTKPNRCRQPLESRLSQKKFCYGWLHRRILRRYRLQCAVNCSALQEQTEGSGPSTNQVSLPNAPANQTLSLNFDTIAPSNQRTFEESKTTALFVDARVSPVKARKPFKNCFNYIDVSHSRQPLVKGERLVRYEVNAVMDRCEPLPE